MILMASFPLYNIAVLVILAIGHVVSRNIVIVTRF